MKHLCFLFQLRNYFVYIIIRADDRHAVAFDEFAVGVWGHLNSAVCTADRNDVNLEAAAKLQCDKRFAYPFFGYAQLNYLVIRKFNEIGDVVFGQHIAQLFAHILLGEYYHVCADTLQHLAVAVVLRAGNYLFNTDILEHYGH